MNKTPWIRHLNIFAMVLVGALAACGGGEDEPIDETEAQEAEVATVEEDYAGKCTGGMPWYCEDVDLERCEAVGCKLQVYEAQNYAMCFGDRPHECADLQTLEQCEQIRNCRWNVE